MAKLAGLFASAHEGSLGIVHCLESQLLLRFLFLRGAQGWIDILRHLFTKMSDKTSLKNVPARDHASRTRDCKELVSKRIRAGA